MMRRLFPWALSLCPGLVLFEENAAWAVTTYIPRDSGSARSCRFTFVPQAVT